MNFSTGIYTTAQGETKSVHSQIGGYPPPISILYSSMKFRTSSVWNTLDITTVTPDTPYWVSERNAGQMKNGTNAHKGQEVALNAMVATPKAVRIGIPTILVLLLGIAFLLTRPAGAGTALPADLQALGTAITSIDGNGVLREKNALEIVRRENPEVFTGSNIGAYLVRLTDPSRPGLFDDRAVWIIKASGLSLDMFSRPMLENGHPAADPGPAVTAYVYIDAVTGEWLTATFVGAPPE